MSQTLKTVRTANTVKILQTFKMSISKLIKNCQKSKKCRNLSKMCNKQNVLLFLCIVLSDSLRLGQQEVRPHLQKDLQLHQRRAGQRAVSETDRDRLRGEPTLCHTGSLHQVQRRRIGVLLRAEFVQEDVLAELVQGLGDQLVLQEYLSHAVDVAAFARQYHTGRAE